MSFGKTDAKFSNAKPIRGAAIDLLLDAVDYTFTVLYNEMLLFKCPVNYLLLIYLMI